MNDLHRFDTLVSGFCDGSLSPVELAELELLLRERHELRQRHLELAALHGSLAWVCAARETRTGEPIASKSSPTRPAARFPWLVPCIGAVTGMAAGLLIVLSLLYRPGSNSVVEIANSPVARLAELTGTAEILKPEGPPVAVAAGQEITLGQTLRINEDNSSGVLEYADGTRLLPGAATTLHLTSWQPSTSDLAAKKVFLSGGLLRAEVATQPTGRPMILATPHAEVRVQGGTVTCSVGTEATRVEMEEGRVQMVRQADGKIIDLAGGSYAISTTEATEELVPRTLLNQVIIPRGNIRLSGSALALSADGQRLATASQGQVTFWNTRTGQKEFSLPARKDEVRWLAFSPDGQSVAGSSAEPGLIVWDLAQHRERFRAESQSPWRTMVYSPDGRWLAAAEEATGKPAGAQILDATTGVSQRLLSAGNASVLALTFSPDGNRLAAGTNDRGVIVWDAASGKELAMLKNGPRKERCDLLTFSADGRWLAGSILGKGMIRLWDAATLTEKMALPGMGRQFRSLTFSPDGRRIAAGTQDGTLFLWNLHTGEEIMSQKVDPRPVRLLAFSTDGRVLTVLGESGLLQHWGVSAVERPGNREER